MQMLTITACSVELFYILFIRYLKNLRSKQLQKAVELAGPKVKLAIPLTVK